MYAPIPRGKGKAVRTAANFDPRQTNPITSRIRQNIKSLQCFIVETSAPSRFSATIANKPDQLPQGER
jgi:hypothetical protein